MLKDMTRGNSHHAQACERPRWQAQVPDLKQSPMDTRKPRRAFASIRSRYSKRLIRHRHPEAAISSSCSLAEYLFRRWKVGGAEVQIYKGSFVNLKRRLGPDRASSVSKVRRSCLDCNHKDASTRSRASATGHSWKRGAVRYIVCRG